MMFNSKSKVEKELNRKLNMFVKLANQHRADLADEALTAANEAALTPAERTFIMEFAQHEEPDEMVQRVQNGMPPVDVPAQVPLRGHHDERRESQIEFFPVV
jgi:hypothetical protein